MRLVHLEAVPIIGSTVGAALENVQAHGPLPLMSPGKVGTRQTKLPPTVQHWKIDFELFKMGIQQQDLLVRSYELEFQLFSGFELKLNRSVRGGMADPLRLHHSFASKCNCM